MSEGGESFDWSVLVPRTIHPVKVAIIEAIEWIGTPMAASELVNVLDEIDNEKFGLSHVSYHLVALYKLGGLKAVCTEQVRGARKTYYYFS